MNAWHMLRYGQDGKTPVLRDGTPALTDGSWLTVEPPLELRRRGLHASEYLLDALWNAPGPIICRVELAGEVVNGGVDVCAQHRRILWWADASRLLRLWACDVAEQALRDYGGEDQRYWIATKVARLYASGEATPRQLLAAKHDAECAFYSTPVCIHCAVALDATHKDSHRAALGVVSVTEGRRTGVGGAISYASKDQRLTRRVLTRARGLGLTTEGGPHDRRPAR